MSPTLENIANIAALVILGLIPVMVLSLFWMVHILPEKIAERKNHPQKEAIKVLVLMSLLFGGMLWPIAWVWTYLKSPKLQISRDGISILPSTEGDDAAAQTSLPLHEEIAALQRRVAAMRPAAEAYAQDCKTLARLQKAAEAHADTASHSTQR